MRVAFVSPYVPTPIRVRPYEWLRRLSADGHEIVLATPSSGEAERRQLGRWSAEGVEIVSRRLPLARSLVSCLAALPSRRPVQTAFCWHPGLARDLRRRLRAWRPDVIHVEHLRGSRYGADLSRWARQARVPIVWDSVDCISALFEEVRRGRVGGRGGVFAGLDLARTRRWERLQVGMASRTLVASRRDRETLLDLGVDQEAGARIEVLTNGVDLERFRPGGERDAATLVFSGKMSYHANLAAARFLLDEVMPVVWRSRPEVRLSIAGSSPPRSLRRRADRRVEITGFVADLGARIGRATVAVAPLRYGAGVQNKILEAMACATPVVATPAAVRGFDTDGLDGVVVAEEAESLAAALVALLADPGRRAALGAAGRARVESHHDWSRLGRRLTEIYAEAATEARP